MFDNSLLQSELFRQRCFPPIYQLVEYVAKMTRNRKTYKRDIQSILGELVHELALSFNENNFIQSCFLKLGLCILSGSEMKFSCPISAVYYFQQYYEYFFDRSDDLKRDFHDFEEFILESISSFDPIALRSSSFKNNSLIYYHEMYRCMRMICDETVSALVGSCFGIRGAVDFYVNSTYKYAIELVKDGKDQSRFMGNGNCENIDINKYALIDFYEDQSIRSKLLFVPIYMFLELFVLSILLS